MICLSIWVIDKWGVVEGGWKFLVMVHIEGGKFLLFVFFLLYVCMIDNSITFFLEWTYS